LPLRDPEVLEYRGHGQLIRRESVTGLARSKRELTPLEDKRWKRFLRKKEIGSIPGKMGGK